MSRTPGSFEDLESGYEGVAEFYDLFASDDDLPFYLEYAKRQGPPILDIAAGTGRVSLALAKAGFEVYAIEKSPSMLSVFRKKIAGQEIAELITIHEGDMTNFNLDTKFPLAIIPTSFGHVLTREQQLSTLRTIRNHLRNDAIFILDLYPGEHIDEHSTFQDGPAIMPDGREVKRYGEITADRKSQLMRLTLRFEVLEPSGTIAEMHEVTSGTALIYRTDVDSLLQSARLKILEEFGDFQKNAYIPESQRRILILSF